jgi:hypothetical protein
MRIALAACVLVAVAGADRAWAAPTWRLDVFHTGGRGTEVFAVDEVVVEPLPWPGHPAGNLDTTGYGTYRFEVREPGGRITYSRGYGPIFAEWATTADAATSYRTFHESFRFPAPAGPVDVVVFRRDATQAFVEVWRTRVDPASPFVNRARPPAQELIEVERHGEPEQAVDLLLLGDGYTAAQCGAKFRADAARMANALFAREPFREHRRDFNVWGLCAPAAEAGVARPSADVQRRTAVGATYDIFGSERYVLTYQNRAFRDVAAWAPYEFATILVNSDTYGGGGLYNVYSTVAVDSAWADYLFVHEFAHHFAALADEYYTSPVAYTTPAKVVEPWEPNVTALLPGTPLKWADLVTPGTALPTPWPKDRFEDYQRTAQAQRAKLRAERRAEGEMNALFSDELAFTTRHFEAAAGTVGAFQGANYDARAYYRPEIDCVMFTRNLARFCAVCRRVLGDVIARHVPPR